MCRKRMNELIFKIEPLSNTIHSRKLLYINITYIMC